jgi:hypothetical protein
MPVVTATKSRGQLARRRHIFITVQDVTDLVRVFLVHAGERQARKTRRRLGIEFWGRTFGEERGAGQAHHHGQYYLPHIGQM